tara:strand:+ start:6824 stop:7423 length:600 start_codon:yes stop_codon:yes gene_type:complete
VKLKIHLKRSNKSIMNITFSKQEKIDILENTISWIIVLMMLVYGVGKFMQFNGAIEVNKTLPELTGMELMWAFYGYSLPFSIIIGLLEILGAVLIFFKRTRLIGCILTSTILVNIILQDIFFNVHTGALITAIILQLFVFIILWMNKSTVIEVFKLLTKNSTKKQPLKKRATIFSITFIAFVTLLFLQRHLISFISHAI